MRSIKPSYHLVFSLILLLSNLNISGQTDYFTIKGDFKVNKKAANESIIVIVGTDTLKQPKLEKHALSSFISEYWYNYKLLFGGKDLYSKSVFINLGNVAESDISIGCHSNEVHIAFTSSSKYPEKPIEALLTGRIIFKPEVQCFDWPLLEPNEVFLDYERFQKELTHEKPKNKRVDYANAGNNKLY